MHRPMQTPWMRGPNPHVLTLQRARVHVGRATSSATNDFVHRSPLHRKTSPRLRVSPSGIDAQWLCVGQRGIGSPDLWATDMPRMDTIKALLSSYTSNFIQSAVNPLLPTQKSRKQVHVEALALTEAIKDLTIPRECFVVSTGIGSNVLHRDKPGTTDRLTTTYVEKGLEIGMDELGVETVDHVVCQIPDELVLLPAKQGELMERLKATCGLLETLCDSGKVQSYGFSLPSFDESSKPLEQLVDKTFTLLSEEFGRFASLQLPQHVGSAMFPLPECVMQFRKEREMLLIGDRPIEAMLSSGNPFHLKTYSIIDGDDVALPLKTAFNLSIAIEKQYMEKIRPENEHLDLPPVEEVSWAHILANQHSQFDNLQVWLYVRETQIFPRVDACIKQFNQHKETEELGFTYSMALNQLLKCFTRSVELVDADRSTRLMTAWKEKKGLLPSDKITTEEVAVMAALSSGMDITLLEEQLSASSSLPFTHKFSSNQLQQIATLAKPHLTE